MKIAIRAHVNPTEDPDRVKMAMRNMFPDATDIAWQDNMLEMASSDIGPLFRRIAEQSIKDTARAFLLRSIRGNVIRFRLNRQAAYAGRLNFMEWESVLGDLEVECEYHDPEGLVKNFTGGSE